MTVEQYMMFVGLQRGMNFNTLMHSCCFMNHQIQICRTLQCKLKAKGKGKVHPTTGN